MPRGGFSTLDVTRADKDPKVVDERPASEGAADAGCKGLFNSTDVGTEGRLYRRASCMAHGWFYRGRTGAAQHLYRDCGRITAIYEGTTDPRRFF